MKYINMKIFQIKQSLKGAYFVHYVTFGPLNNLQTIIKSKATMITKERKNGSDNELTKGNSDKRGFNCYKSKK